MTEDLIINLSIENLNQPKPYPFSNPICNTQEVIGQCVNMCEEHVKTLNDGYLMMLAVGFGLIILNYSKSWLLVNLSFEDPMYFEYLKRILNACKDIGLLLIIAYIIIKFVGY